MSETKNINDCKISADEFNKVKISAMSDRPNAMSTYGGAKKSASDVKAAFDKPTELVIQKHNDLVEAVIGKESVLDRNDAARKEAEDTRAKAESARVIAEADRVTAENARDAAREAFEGEVNEKLESWHTEMQEALGQQEDAISNHYESVSNSLDAQDAKLEAQDAKLEAQDATIESRLAAQEERLGGRLGKGGSVTLKASAWSGENTQTVAAGDVSDDDMVIFYPATADDREYCGLYGVFLSPESVDGYFTASARAKPVSDISLKCYVIRGRLPEEVE